MREGGREGGGEAGELNDGMGKRSLHSEKETFQVPSKWEEPINSHQPHPFPSLIQTSNTEIPRLHISE